MRHPARWYLDRLRAMSVAEVVHRGGRAVTLPFASRHSLWSGPAAAGAYPRFPIAGDPVGAARAMRGPPAPHSTDRRLAWEHLRGHDWVAVAAVADRDPGARAWLVPAIRAWRARHPPGATLAWGSAMEAAIRIFALVAVGGLAGPDPLYDRMILEHARFVAPRRSAYSSANNHLVVELAALVLAARVTARPAPHRDALGALERAVAAQVLADGVHAEMATHYHAFVLEALALVAASERAGGASYPWLEATIAAMSAYLAAVTCGDGSVLHQGDDDGGRIVPGFALPSAPAPTCSRRFAASGQVVLRSPRLHAVLDAGPFGFGALAAHAHCDALALSLAIDGAPLLVDRGTYRYTDDGGMRDRLRGTAAHNTLQVGGLEQADARGPFLWGRRPAVTLERADLADRDVVIASHDGFAPAIHRRTVIRDRDALLVVDRAATAHRLTQRFHLPPGVDAATDIATDGAVITTPRGWFAVTGTPSLVTTPHSPRYDVLESALTLEVRGTGELACVIGAGAYDPVIARAMLAARAP